VSVVVQFPGETRHRRPSAHELASQMMRDLAEEAFLVADLVLAHRLARAQPGRTVAPLSAILNEAIDRVTKRD
jgi:hypothetical protein